MSPASMAASWSVFSAPTWDAFSVANCVDVRATDVGRGQALHLAGRQRRDLCGGQRADRVGGQRLDLVGAQAAQRAGRDRAQVGGFQVESWSVVSAPNWVETARRTGEVPSAFRLSVVRLPSWPVVSAWTWAVDSLLNWSDERLLRSSVLSVRTWSVVSARIWPELRARSWSLVRRVELGAGQRAQRGGGERAHVCRLDGGELVAHEAGHLGRAEGRHLAGRQRDHVAGRQALDLQRRQGGDLGGGQRADRVGGEALDLAGELVGRQRAELVEVSVANWPVPSALRLSVVSALSWPVVSDWIWPGGQLVELVGAEAVQVIAVQRADLARGQRGDLAGTERAQLVAGQGVELGAGQRAQRRGGQGAHVGRLDGGELVGRQGRHLGGAQHGDLGGAQRDHVVGGQALDLHGRQRRHLGGRERGDLVAAQRGDLVGRQARQRRGRDGAQVGGFQARELVGRQRAELAEDSVANWPVPSAFRLSVPRALSWPVVSACDLARGELVELVRCQRVQVVGVQRADLGGGQRLDLAGGAGQRGARRGLADRGASDHPRPRAPDFSAYRQRLASAAPTLQSAESERQSKGQVQAAVEDRKPAAAPTPDKLTLSKAGSTAASAAEAKASKDTEKKDAAARVAELTRNEGYELLARAEFYNSASTAPNSMISELSDQKLESFVTDQFNRITGVNPVRPVQMVRTIGTDAELIKRIVGELALRLPHEGRRVVIVAERDSLYAQSLVSELKYRLPDSRAKDQPVRIEVIYFFRGIDGVTTRESGAPTSGPPSKTVTLEWPESRDQLDYLRRLGAELKRSETGPHAAADRRHRHLRQRRARQAAGAAGAARGLLRPHVLHDGHGRALPASAHAGVHAQPRRGQQPAAGLLPTAGGCVRRGPAGRHAAAAGHLPDGHDGHRARGLACGAVRLCAGQPDRVPVPEPARLRARLAAGQPRGLRRAAGGAAVTADGPARAAAAARPAGRCGPPASRHRADGGGGVGVAGLAVRGLGAGCGVRQLRAGGMAGRRQCLALAPHSPAGAVRHPVDLGLGLGRLAQPVASRLRLAAPASAGLAAGGAQRPAPARQRLVRAGQRAVLEARRGLQLRLRQALEGIPEVPVRGDEHRQMVTATLYAILLLLPLLVVAVADATMLLMRFVRHLNAGRSFYPDSTIEMFAKALGEEHKALWAQRFCARPEDRSKDGGGFTMHTLLDDWIDVQVVARRSAPVARLVIGPVRRAGAAGGGAKPAVRQLVADAGHRDQRELLRGRARRSDHPPQARCRNHAPPCIAVDAGRSALAGGQWQAVVGLGRALQAAHRVGGERAVRCVRVVLRPAAAQGPARAAGRRGRHAAVRLPAARALKGGQRGGKAGGLVAGDVHPRQA
ncbi:hypothetical protein OSTOST_05722, partial [Ostertagia ostertagi]